MTFNLKVVMNTDACLTDTPQLQLRNTCEMMLPRARGHSQIPGKGDLNRLPTR